MVGFGHRSEKLTGYDYAFAGAFSGLITRGFCQPFDVVKIRFQLQVEPIKKHSSSKYQSINQAIVTIWKEEGWKSFWKGHVPAQMLSVVYGLAQFWTFEMMTRNIKAENTSVSYKPVISFLCGSVAGKVNTILHKNLVKEPFHLISSS